MPELVGKLGNHAEQSRPEYRLKALCRLLFRQNRRRGVSVPATYCGPSPVRIHVGLSPLLLKRVMIQESGMWLRRFASEMLLCFTPSMAATSVCVRRPVD